MDANGWIKVKERLPEVPCTMDDNIYSSAGVDCLACFPIRSEYGDYFKIVMAVYFPYAGPSWCIRRNNGFSSGKDITHKVTHWQSFPKGPEGL